MRLILVFALVALAISTAFGCQSTSTPTATAPATSAAASVAASPAEALEQSLRAMMISDEAAYRAATLIRSPSGYSESYVRWAFAGARLHDAVRVQGVMGNRVRSGGFDREFSLSPGIPALADAKQMEATLPSPKPSMSVVMFCGRAASPSVRADPLAAEAARCVDEESRWLHQNSLNEDFPSAPS